MADAPSSYDPHKAQASWQAIQAHVAGLAPAELKRRNANLAEAAQRTLHFATVVLTPERRAVLAKLPLELFDASQMDLLEHLAWVAAAANVERHKAMAQVSDAKLTPTLEASSKERRKRMLDLVDYHLGEHPDHADEVDDIASGQGILDRSQDLARLADLYAAAPDVVTTDTKNYRADDLSEARRESDEILSALAAAGAPLGFLDHERRVWTLLERTYRDARATYDWAFRSDARRPKVAPLTGAGRRTRKPAPDVTPPT